MCPFAKTRSSICICDLVPFFAQQKKGKHSVLQAEFHFPGGRLEGFQQVMKALHSEIEPEIVLSFFFFLTLLVDSYQFNRRSRSNL